MPGRPLASAGAPNKPRLVLAVYLSKRVDGFDLDEFLGLLRTVRDKNPNRKAVSRWKESFPGRVIDRVKRIKEQVPDR